MSECMARVFAVRVQFGSAAGVIAVQALVRPLLSPGAERWFEDVGAVSRCNLVGTRNLSRCRTKLATDERVRVYPYSTLSLEQD